MNCIDLSGEVLAEPAGEGVPVVWLVEQKDSNSACVRGEIVVDFDGAWIGCNGIQLLRLLVYADDCCCAGKAKKLDRGWTVHLTADQNKNGL